MSHTTRSTLFFATASSFQEHRRQRLESISLRTRRSVLRANIGNEWNTPDLHTWRSQPNLNKQVWSSPSTSHHATFVLGSSTVVTWVGSVDQSRACDSTSLSPNAFVDQHLRSLSRRLLPAPKNVTFREQPVPPSIRRSVRNAHLLCGFFDMLFLIDAHFIVTPFPAIAAGP
jgi:hypothetical protein